MKTRFALMATLPLFWWACSRLVEHTASGLIPSRFETTVDGKSTALYTLRNSTGMEVCITNFGGRIVSILVPDRNGEMRDVVLGFDNINDYLSIPSDFGAAIGRYANRIDHGRLIIDEDTLQLPLNNFGHCLHGGPEGWQYKVYEALQLDGKSLELLMHSPDGDENFPGNVEAKVSYTLTDDNAIVIAYEATTDAPTVINMTNHSYFNLSGNPRNTILDHILTINADSYTPVDTTYMTTGEILPVEGSPMDFRQATAIGAQISDSCEQLENAHGYDHNWVLATAGNIDTIAARLVSPKTGICLTVRTTEPGIQVYSGNFLDGSTIGKDGIAYNTRTALCLETQHYPDSPNKPQWPSTLLRPGETYRSLCIYEFTLVE